MWQPGMPLIPIQQGGAPMGMPVPQQTMPVGMPQMMPGMPQPMPQQFVQQMMPQAMPQPITAAPMMQQQPSFIPFPVQQGPPVMEMLKQQMVVNEQFVQTPGQAPAITYAAPAAVAAPQGFAQPAVTYAAPQAAVTEVMAAPQFSQTVMGQPMMMPGMQYAAPGQNLSYIPAPMPQNASYVPAAPQIIAAQPQVSSYVPQPQMASYIPAMQPQTIETLAPQVTYAAPQATVMQQPVSYIPAPVIEYAAPTQFGAPVMEAAMPAGQSVIVEQAGDWLVCEDALGIFYHHTPTQQSFDNVPEEFLGLFPQGYNPPAVGAFAAAGYGVQETLVAQEVAYGAPMAPQVIMGGMPTTIMSAAPQVTYAAPAQMMGTQTMVGQPMMMQQPMVMQGQPMMQQQFATMQQPMMQAQPMMAKVL